jgi:hypothetical protein
MRDLNGGLGKGNDDLVARTFDEDLINDERERLI